MNSTATVSVLILTILSAVRPLPAAAQTAPVFQTPNDTIPNFALGSKTNGNWADAGTWDLGRVPVANDVVAIVTGHTVTVSTLSATAKTVGIWSGAQLTFDPHQNSRLRVGTLLVMPDGALEVGTAATPIDADKTVEIVIANQPLHLTDDGLDVFDPQQYGTGVLGWGRVTIHGAPRNSTFIRVAQDPQAGDMRVILESPVTGWRPGDELFLPDSRHLKWNEVGDDYVSQAEEIELASVSVDGTSLTLKRALPFDHLGARDADGRQDYLPANGTERDRIWFRTHVINRTRNVVFRSEEPAGTRGHVLLTHRADVDIRYARFQDLGRTKTFAAVDSTTFDEDAHVAHMGMNQIGRYALHMHHLIGPAGLPANRPQFLFAAPAYGVWSAITHD